MNNREMKEATKEAIKEWLDHKFAMFGKWTMGALGAALFSAFAYLILWANGWHK